MLTKKRILDAVEKSIVEFQKDLKEISRRNNIEAHILECDYHFLLAHRIALKCPELLNFFQANQNNRKVFAQLMYLQYKTEDKKSKHKGIFDIVIFDSKTAFERNYPYVAIEVKHHRRTAGKEIQKDLEKLKKRINGIREPFFVCFNDSVEDSKKLNDALAKIRQRYKKVNIRIVSKNDVLEGSLLS